MRGSGPSRQMVVTLSSVILLTLSFSQEEQGPCWQSPKQKGKAAVLNGEWVFFWEHRLEGVGSESAEYRPAPVTLSNPQEEPDSREAGWESGSLRIFWLPLYLTLSVPTHSPQSGSQQCFFQ